MTTEFDDLDGLFGDFGVVGKPKKTTTVPAAAPVQKPAEPTAQAEPTHVQEPTKSVSAEQSVPISESAQVQKPEPVSQAPTTAPTTDDLSKEVRAEEGRLSPEMEAAARVLDGLSDRAASETSKSLQLQPTADLLAEQGAATVKNKLPFSPADDLTSTGDPSSDIDIGVQEPTREFPLVASLRGRDGPIPDTTELEPTEMDFTDSDKEDTDPEMVDPAIFKIVNGTASAPVIPEKAKVVAPDSVQAKQKDLRDKLRILDETRAGLFQYIEVILIANTNHTEEDKRNLNSILDYLNEAKRDVGILGTHIGQIPAISEEFLAQEFASLEKLISDADKRITAIENASKGQTEMMDQVPLMLKPDSSVCNIAESVVNTGATERYGNDPTSLPPEVQDGFDLLEQTRMEKPVAPVRPGLDDHVPDVIVTEDTRDAGLPKPETAKQLKRPSTMEELEQWIDAFLERIEFTNNPKMGVVLKDWAREVRGTWKYNPELLSIAIETTCQRLSSNGEQYVSYGNLWQKRFMRKPRPNIDMLNMLEEEGERAETIIGMVRSKLSKKGLSDLSIQFYLPRFFWIASMASSIYVGRAVDWLVENVTLKCGFSGVMNQSDKKIFKMIFPDRSRELSPFVKGILTLSVVSFVSAGVIGFCTYTETGRNAFNSARNAVSSAWNSAEKKIKGLFDDSESPSDTVQINTVKPKKQAAQSKSQAKEPTKGNFQPATETQESVELKETAKPAETAPTIESNLPADLLRDANFKISQLDSTIKRFKALENAGDETAGTAITELTELKQKMQDSMRNNDEDAVRNAIREANGQVSLLNRIAKVRENEMRSKANAMEMQGTDSSPKPKLRY